MSYTFVSGSFASNGEGPSTTGTCAYAANNAAGNLLVLTCSTQGGPTATGVTDSAGNTWALARGGAALPAGSEIPYIFYAYNSKAGANTVTLGLSSSGDWQMNVSEWSLGSAINFNPLDQISAQSTGNSSAASTALPVCQAHDLLINNVINDTVDPTVGAGFTDLYNLHVLNYEFAQYLLDSGAAGAQSVPTIGTQNNWSSIAVSFKTAASSVSFVPPRRQRRVVTNYYPR
jgi:hypothetical protein